jgi:hypothetical protein
VSTFAPQSRFVNKKNGNNQTACNFISYCGLFLHIHLPTKFINLHYVIVAYTVLVRSCLCILQIAAVRHGNRTLNHEVPANAMQMCKLAFIKSEFTAISIN